MMMSQMGQLAKSPLADPEKNPQALQMMGGGAPPPEQPVQPAGAPNPESDNELAPVPGAE